MSNYRRPHISGATWFFTANLAERDGNALLLEHIDQLKAAFRYVKDRHPFHVEAIVVLPEHLHCIWTLPDGDANFACGGVFLNNISHGIFLWESRYPQAEGNVKNAAFGNDDFGSMQSGIRAI